MRVLSKDLATKSALSVVFFAVVLTICGLRSTDIAVIILLTSTQIFVGALVWLVYRSRYQVCFAETVGMGAAIGFALALISSQLFRTLLPRSVTWAILPLIAVAISLKAINNSSLSHDKSLRSLNEICIIFSGTLIALSTSWYWLIPTAVAMSVLTTWAILRSNQRVQTRAQQVLLNLFGAVGFALSLNALYGLTSLEKIRNPVWWVWRFAKIQDPDVLFGESMMHSVGMFGNGDNIFFAGAKIHYHWLSFAWNDTLNALYQTDSFVVTGIAAPLIVLFVIMCLVAAFAGRFVNSRVSVPVLVLAISAMCAGPIPFVRTLHPYSYSFNFSLIYVFAILILLLSTDKSKLITNSLLLSIFTAVLIGSKVSSAPAVIFGFLIATIYSAIKIHKHAKYEFLLSCVAATATLIVWYLIYYSSTAETPNSIKYGFGVIFEQKAFLVAGLPVVAFAIGVVSILFLITYSFVGVFWARAISSSTTRFALVFSLAGGLASLFLGVLFFDVGENLAYLIQIAIALILPISIVAICDSQHLEPRRSREIFFSALVGAGAAKISWSVFSGVTGNRAPVAVKSSLAIAIPLLGGLLLFVVVRLLFRFTAKRAMTMVAVLMISSGTLGSYAAFASGFYQDGVSYNLLHVDEADTITGSKAYREMLIWLRDHSRTDDIVATNRYCSDSYQSPPDCLALWNLTSAISKRQMLVEGLWPSQSEDLSLEREKRRLLIKQFVDGPSDATHVALLSYGVKWVVADFAATLSRSWDGFADVRFTNTAGAILELKKAMEK